MPQDYECDQCQNRIRVYVEPCRTVTGLPEVWCLRSAQHKRNQTRRMVETAQRYAVPKLRVEAITGASAG